MTHLNVFIEINGIQTKVGTLTGNDYHDAYFIYDAEYLSSDKSAPISVSLPLNDQPFSSGRTRSFFESLLPEGFSRKAVSNWAKVNEEDYLSLLKELGRECIGALQISENERIEEGSYKPVKNNELLCLAKEGATKSTEILMETRISLAGASGKVGLYYDTMHNKWYQPSGIAASTHIVKQSHVRFDHLVLNEYLCMRTASKLNIEVPNSFIVNVGDDEEVLFAIERYDRIRQETETKPVSPLRLHQEDFAQALGIPAKEKYETEDRKYLKRIFELLNDYSANPIEDGLKLWDRVIFNYLIGNTDAHIKNYALLYSADLKKIRLSPAYDIVSTRVYGNRNEMSVMIDGKSDCTMLTRESFKNAAGELMIGPKPAMKHFDYLANNMESALKASAKELADAGLKGADTMAERILKASML